MPLCLRAEMRFRAEMRLPADSIVIANATKQSPGYAKLMSRIAPSHSLLALVRSSPPVEDDAGDDKHGCHRQHLREHFRGRPPGSVLHAVLPRLGHNSPLPAKARRSGWLYSEHPTTSIRFDESPLSEYRLCQGRTAMRRHFGPPAAGLCARNGFLWREVCHVDGRKAPKPRCLPSSISQHARRHT